MIDTHWRDFWTDFSHEAYDHINRLSANQQLLARASELAGTGGVVLDAGCGTGNLTLLLAAGNQVLAVDYSPGMVQAARAKTKDLPNVRVEQADVCALPSADDSFDAVVSVNVLFNVVDPAQAVAEAWRVLKPGGLFVVASPAEGRAYSESMQQSVIADAAANKVPQEHLMAVWQFQSQLAQGGVNYAPSEEEFATLLATNGFEVVSWEDTYYGVDFLVVARKPHRPSPSA